MKIFDFFKRSNVKTEESEYIEQQQNLLDVVEILTESLVLHFKHIKGDKLDFSDSLIVLTDGDIVTTSQALMLVHESLNVKLDYQPLNEYEHFETLKDVVDYFLARYDYRINIENPNSAES